MDKNHNISDICCFCAKKHPKESPGILPTIIFYIALIKLVMNIATAYFLFEAFSKVLNFPAWLTVSCGVNSNCSKWIELEEIVKFFYQILFALIMAIFITGYLEAVLPAMVELYQWVRYKQSILIGNCQPCTGPDQLCPPWYDPTAPRTVPAISFKMDILVQKVNF